MAARLTPPPWWAMAEVSEPSVGAPGTETEEPSVPWETSFVPKTPLNSPLLGATWAIQTSSTWPPVTTTLRSWADELPRALAVCTPPTQDLEVSFRTHRWSWRREGLSESSPIQPTY